MAAVIVACPYGTVLLVDVWRLRDPMRVPVTGNGTELVRRWRWSDELCRYVSDLEDGEGSVEIPTSTQLNLFGGVLEDLLSDHELIQERNRKLRDLAGER